MGGEKPGGGETAEPRSAVAPGGAGGHVALEAG